MINQEAVSQLMELEKRRATVIRKLASNRPMLRGSCGLIYRRCGKAACKCNQDKGHPRNRLIWSENGKVKTKTIPVADIKWVKEMTLVYHSFKEYRLELINIDDEINRILTSLCEEIIVETKKLKPYL